MSDTQEASVRISERAARRVAQILESEPPGARLRVSVNGGGCSGFQYAFDIERDRAEDDILVGGGEVEVLIDPVSMQYLAGSEIDFVSDLMGQSFRVHNPQATASCGCGTSFSI
jgi:iron-sulfur cluster assembly accessory protein